MALVTVLSLSTSTGKRNSNSKYNGGKIAAEVAMMIAIAIEEMRLMVSRLARK